MAATNPRCLLRPLISPPPPRLRRPIGASCILLLLLLHRAAHVKALSAPPSARSPSPTGFVSHPCLGRATAVSSEGQRTHYYVIGTSHVRCQSAAEVESLLQAIQPDGVVVELDPERVIRLTKEGSKHPGEEQLFGADFLAAIDTARDMDVPLFIGDEYQKETRDRFVETALDPQSYGPGRLLAAIVSFYLPMQLQRKSSDGASHEYVSVLEAFVADPTKFAPLAATASPAFLLFLATLQNYRIDDVGNDAATLLSLLVSFFATCKVFNNFIVDRDAILANNALRAAKVVASLKRGETIRARWTFTVNGNDAKSINGSNLVEGIDSINRMPLFTLKTPLLPSKIRNLNLFEPRWLKMIDDVCSRSETVSSQTFGCVTCTNKFYSAIQIDGVEGRYADVVFERKGTLAEIIGLKEGKRPVSGDRKIGVQIEGRDEFLVDEDKLAISREGYLVASDVGTVSGNEGSIGNGVSHIGKEDTSIVVVVGLLHANGVIQRLSECH